MTTAQAIPVFVISLVNADARRTRIKKHLNRLGIHFEFIDAVNTEVLDETYLCQITDSQYRFSRGSIGCALSHFVTYQRIVDRQIACALILEDDAVLDQKVVALLHNQRLSIHDYCFLGCDDLGTVDLSGHVLDRVVAYDRKSTREIADKIYTGALSHGPYRTHAYLISNSAASRRLGEAFPLQFPINWYHHLNSHYAFEAIIRPRLAWISPVGLDSSIQIPHGTSGRIALLDYLKRYKWFFPLKDLVKRRKRRLRSQIQKHINEKEIPPANWDCLPWDNADVLFLDV